MTPHPDADDFFEEDEPLEKVLEAYQCGKKGVTSPPFATRSVVHPNQTTFTVDVAMSATRLPEMSSSSSSWGTATVVTRSGRTLSYGVHVGSGGRQDVVTSTA